MHQGIVGALVELGWRKPSRLSIPSFEQVRGDGVNSGVIPNDDEGRVNIFEIFRYRRAVRHLYRFHEIETEDRENLSLF